MANICSTFYVFDGATEAVKRLHDFLYPLTDGGQRSASAKTVLEVAGIDTKQHGFRLDLCFVEENIRDAGDGNSCFEASTASAWAAFPEFFYLLLGKLGINGVEVCYSAEECGCEYYVKHDPTGKYFPEKYRTDIYIEDHALAKKYGIENDDYTEEKLTGFLKGIFGADKGLPELLADAKAFHEKLVVEGKGYYLIQEYKAA